MKNGGILPGGALADGGGWFLLSVANVPNLRNHLKLPHSLALRSGLALPYGAVLLRS